MTHFLLPNRSTVDATVFKRRSVQYRTLLLHCSRNPSQALSAPEHLIPTDNLSQHDQTTTRARGDDLCSSDDVLNSLKPVGP